MQDLDAYQGTVEEVIYANEENGYAVFEFDANDTGLITCVGYIPYIKAGEMLIVSGKWTNHSSYGEQLKVEYFERIEPTGRDEILSYLSSGVVRGVRKSTAEKIVNRFGEDSLHIIVDMPERLAEIKGISLAKAYEIQQSYMQIFEKEQLILFLQKYNITPAFAVRIYDTFGESAVKIIQENPYSLCERIRGISFKTADLVAHHMGIRPEDTNRIRSGIKYTLSFYAASGGHTYLPRNILVSLAQKMLGVDSLEIENAIVSLIIDGQIVSESDGEEECIYLPVYYECEHDVAAQIRALAGHIKKGKKENPENEIKELEKESGIVLEEKQKQAVVCALTSGVTVITGGPGTGKTTTINFIIKLLKKRGLDIALTAPTGRAAKRMSAVTDEEAKTIHRLLELGYTGDELERDYRRSSEFPLEHDVIIVDEVSMVDILLMQALLAATKPGARVVFVGDSDQLPSVGAGNVLEDIIDSDTVPVIRLDTVFRQAEESMIVVNAHRINGGEYPIYNQKDKDFFFIPAKNGDEITRTVVNLVCERLPQAYGFDPMRDIQVISPMKKTPAGVYQLNAELQKALNPPDDSKRERAFMSRILREGDKVMQVKNNYDLVWEKIGTDLEGIGVYNGDIGYIETVTSSSVTVIFDDDRRAEYANAMLDELELAYAITVHKSQGSEFPAVVMPVFHGAPMLMNRNLIYTAITRAKDFVTLVGQKSAAEKMVDNDFEAKRYSNLIKWLKEENF
ncbi:MAG: ATP-dependent RecD-like DNA helicase [Clostridia bacterium]|nr:ATP-dependent RecD-like DNA helicase [Clostridia bacterium]